MNFGSGDGRNVSRYLLQRLRSINEVLELREQRQSETGSTGKPQRASDEPRKDDENLATAGTSAGESSSKR